MTAIDFTTGPTPARLHPSIWVQAATELAVAFRSWRNRRQLYRLGALTDTELKDIGLTRTDLFMARAEPLGTDPTLYLRAIAASR
jgi:uncharacterized protein YjiS (DUF1127 family)